MKIMECVPNFSEGRNLGVIEAIANAIRSVEGVKLLDVDPGKATNRTVMTMVGEPDFVVEAAFRAIVKAADLIDMSKHSGEHPRMGATDVCPFIPISGVTMDDAIRCAHQLGEKLAKETNISGYYYESAASSPQRRNLADVRSGEYEGLASKILQPEWKPDYGKAVFNEKSGATIIGARDFLIAYNVNLNTKNTRRANSVAFDVREAGRVKRDGDPITGKIILDENGEQVRIPGKLKHVKGIGWYIEEYGICQVSLNLTNIRETPLHVVFDEIEKSSNARGLRVTGSELVGLVPLSALLDAGRFFLKKQGSSAGASEEELIQLAVKSLGLDELSPFDPHKKIIEYQLRDAKKTRLVSMSLKAFANETASDSPAPGGGSIAAYAGALGASLSTMVANLSAHKRGWDARLEEFSGWAEKGQRLKDDLLGLVDEDTRAFDGIMNAFGLPKETPEEKAARKQAIQAATKYAVEVPFFTMQKSFEVFEIAEAMVKVGNPNSVTDAGVGALCARTAVYGAWMNVQINLGGLEELGFKAEIIQKSNDLLSMANQKEQEIVALVQTKL
jgi:glutamate formiminotransferase/formiminotetrahydrofolate cyclodeaminase